MFKGKMVLVGLTFFMLSTLLSGCNKIDNEKDSIVENTLSIENKESNQVKRESHYKASTAISINPIEGLREDAIKGADVSMLYDIEANGGTFKNDLGEVQDCLEILQDHGVNWIRLRLWNNPKDVTWASSISSVSDVAVGPIGGGNNDLERTVAIAKRAKSLGLKVLLDFHYSDFWADPGKQNKPIEWADLSGEDLGNALYDYTKDVLNQLKLADALPEMVQVGNEINNGMVWPDGKDITSKGCIDLLKKGTQAVRDIDPSIKIMIHLAEGGDKAQFIRGFDALTAQGLDYDIIGASYYPYWHGTLEELQDNLETISKKYNKEVLVAEVAYGYTTREYDEGNNIFNSGLEKIGGYQATIQGQASVVRDVMEVVSNVPDNKGLGLFYWEPTWIVAPNTGWVKGEGNGWENQALFDSEGNTLPSLDVFNRISDNTIPAVEPKLQSVTTGEKVVELGNEVVLPPTMKGLYTTGAYKNVPVVWEPIDESLLVTEGKFVVHGMAEDKSTSMTITIKDSHSLIKNPGFETGDLSEWEVVATGELPVKIGKEGENTHSGSYALNYWLGKDFEANLSQTIGGLEDGTYQLSVWVMGESTGESETVLSGTINGSTATVSLVNKGYGNWNQYVIDDLVIKGNDLTVALHIKEKNGSWAWIDDLNLEKVE